MEPRLSSNRNILGVDVGEVRIGLALASEAAKLPRPYKIISNTKEVLQEIAVIANREDVATVVVGLPRNLSGTETAQTHTIRQFADNLKNEVNLPVILVDESLSTQRALEARKDLKDRGQADPVDDLAACFILEEFLRD